ncbi:AAA family ATPase [Endozoicomonas sp. (ex Bugula neritina AB1)]|nr:AAA family ATPase [Endozoicomonas sp. (ex Bugula neritina AB1)]
MKSAEVCPVSPLSTVLELENRINKEVLGQQEVIRSILLTLLCDGNLLLEGLPGLAKTRVIRVLAKHLEGDFRRLQFTPDLLPSDITGAEVYFQDKEQNGFRFRPGPLFGHLVLIDEINRAPAKVQSALLEAMEERQITVAGVSHPLPRLFMALATQNPVEQDGTYPLPEAQLDRFLMKVVVDYPNKNDERNMLRLVRSEQKQKLDDDTGENGSDLQTTQPVSQNVIFDSWCEIADIHVSEAIEKYIIDLIDATRHPSALDGGEELQRWIQVGASPRASLALEKSARANAWLEGRDYVSPLDIQTVIYPVLRHRLLLTYKASAEGIGCDEVIGKLLSLIVAS